MKRIWIFCMLIGFFSMNFIACSRSESIEQTCTSPDGHIRVSVNHHPENGAITFLVLFKSDTVIGNSPLGLKLSAGNLNFLDHLSFTGYQERLIDEAYDMPSGKRRERRNHCTEAVYGFENDSGVPMSVIFHLYNDGIAYRYHIGNEVHSSVLEELSGYRIKGISNVWMRPFSPNDEQEYKKYDPADSLLQQALSFPVLLESVQGHWFLFSESDVSAYPLSSGAFHKDLMRYVFPRDSERENSVPPGFKSPWRVAIMGDQISTIVESCVIDHLAPATVMEDFSWIKAGVASFPWWGENSANGHPEILKKYIDLSSLMNWDYMEFDVALIGSPIKAVEDWKTTPWIKDIVEYGNQKGVKCYGWDEFSNLNTAEKRADIFSRYKELGIVGCKVDFVKSYSQGVRESVEEIILDAAKYKLLLSFHSAQSPRGFARTYPHVMTFEGVKGSEFYLEVTGGRGFLPAHNCILPFTRNVLGSMDYTPVAFTTDTRTSTMAHELALSVVFESGWQGLCDVPEAYLESPARPFLTGLPAAWDETLLLDGYPGEFCCIARRHGADWYVAGISSTVEKTVSVDLSPILEKDQKLVLYTDLPGREDALQVEEREVSGTEALVMELKENGGFAFKFSKK